MGEDRLRKVGHGPAWEWLRDAFFRMGQTVRRGLRSTAGRAIVKGLCVFLAFVTVAGAMALCISAALCAKVRARITTPQALADAGEPYDCVLVLGCAVYEDGRLSPMLADRVSTGAELVQAGVSDTLLVSGDHRTDAYNEVDAMKRYAVELGIPSERVFQDHDGYSTYESIARLKQVFGARRVVIVTQRYHLYRALYLAEKLGLEAVGVAADRQSYSGSVTRGLREVLARCKDVYFGLVQPEPEVLGDPISLDGNGDLTADARPNS